MKQTWQAVCAVKQSILLGCLCTKVLALGVERRHGFLALTASIRLGLKCFAVRNTPSVVNYIKKCVKLAWAEIPVSKTFKNPDFFVISVADVFADETTSKMCRL
jgi:hypothetical protein